MPSRELASALDLRAPAHRREGRLAWRWRRVLALLLGDVIALAVAGKLAALLNQFYSPLPPALDWGIVLGLPGLFWLFALGMLGVFAWGGLYSSTAQQRDYARSGQLVSLVFLLSLMAQYFYDPHLAPPRSFVLTAWLSSMALVVGLRLLTTTILQQIEKSSATPVKVFLIAPAARLPELARALERQHHYRIVGAAFSSMAASPATTRALRQSGAQEVLAEGLPATELASSLYWQLRRSGITLRLIPSSVETLHRRGVPEIFAGVPTLRVEPPLLGGWDYLLGASVGLIALVPLVVAVAMAQRCSDPGPIFFRQERIGLHGRPFKIWKFRTMRPDAPELQAALEAQNQSADGVLFKLKDDPRVTPIGAFLRRTSLDELPQLFNVILGQMSLVGPRPLPLRDVERFDPWHHVRHQVLPGITGLWQISGRSDLGEFNDAARLDLYYIDNWSLNLDLEILLQTVGIVLLGKGAY
jgi:exopolysaccharide biosynthesis polyprenyl glycosylphosphotransferase